MDENRTFKIITMATLKGGAGKTMNSFNIAGVLSETKRVLLIDVDPQCNLTSNCGIDITDRSACTIKDIIDNRPGSQPTPEEVIIKSPIEALPSLDIIPSSILLLRSERQMPNRGDRERIIEKYLTRYQDIFNEYDYIFFDTNPSMSIINTNAFLVADNIILSCDVSQNSITGVELFCEFWDEDRQELSKEDNIAAILVSNFDGRSNLAKDFMEYISEDDLSKDIILESIINTTVKLKETETNHMPINVLYPKTKACQQYRAVVHELFEKEVL